MAASLLTEGDIALEGVPPLDDVKTMRSLLQYLGARVHFSEAAGLMHLKVSDLRDFTAPYELVGKMRASVLVMGPLLARYGRARISQPGGCAIGLRPIDLHVKGMMALGADIVMGHGYIEARAKALQGARIYLDYPSVGATENTMMAAVLAAGTTILENCAQEPEIVDLANFLNTLGARVSGAGTSVIRIHGVESLQGGRHSIIPDRVEAGTYMLAAAITRGQVLLENVITDHMKPVLAKLEEAGVVIEEQEDDGLLVSAPDGIKAVDIKTLPYPGFPTDLQPQFMALMATARGNSVITETVFENRFMHVPQLQRMGCQISIEGRSALVKGPSPLAGTTVKVPDLRAGAALILAGLAATGPTWIREVHHIDRGYYQIVDKLADLGARISRIKVGRPLAGAYAAGLRVKKAGESLA
jgi:UDP-N-acetylglucosamine 1-carboxyvinyltransferase